MAHRVLIVEDNPFIAKLWSKRLEMEGYEIRLAPDGRTARLEMRGWRPDAVLLDLVLPETDGLTLCREWRADSSLAGLKVVFVSAASSRQEMLAAREAGANAFVSKSPTAASQLVAALARHLVQGVAEEGGVSHAGAVSGG
jgi:DNA-binding response OmpR family regulator